MAAALVKADFAEIIVLCLNFDRDCTFAVGFRDLFVRQLLKICIFKNFIQRSDEIVIGTIPLCVICRSVPATSGLK